MLTSRRSLVSVLIAALVVAGITAPAVLAHSGGLNGEGCHTNRRTGDYHCHRAQRSPTPRPRPTPTPRPTATPTSQPTMTPTATLTATATATPAAQVPATSATLRPCTPTPRESIVAVNRVIDGDTFVVTDDGVPERVRLLDVWAPERHLEAGIQATR